MIKQIVSGYVGVLHSLIRFVILLAVCVCVALLIVYPLWSLATLRPNLYTVIFGILVGGLLVFLAQSAFRRSYKKNPRQFILKISGIMTLIIGLISAIALVLAFKRIFAGIVLVVTLCLYGFLAFGLSPESRSKKTEEQ
jgi:hypothetical protein